MAAMVVILATSMNVPMRSERNEELLPEDNEDREAPDVEI